MCVCVPQELVQPHRVWLADAELQLVSLSGADAVWLCLFNDLLLVCTRVLLSFKFSARLALEKTLVLPLADSAHYQNVWQLQHEDECFTLVAASAEQKLKWLQLIGGAVEALLAAQPHLTGTPSKMT